MEDYYKHPPRLRKQPIPKRFQYPAAFKEFHALIKHLTAESGKVPGSQAGIVGMAISALSEIEKSMWVLIEKGFGEDPEYFHIINAQLFTRTALEITARSLLFLHDNCYIRRWEFSDWEQMVLLKHFENCIFKGNTEPTTYAPIARQHHSDYTKALKLNYEDEAAVVRKFLGTATEEDKVRIRNRMDGLKQMPSVREIADGGKKNEPILNGSKNIAAAQVIYRHYKFLCHPAHGSKNSFMHRAAFRGDIPSAIPPIEMVDQEFQQETFWPVVSVQLLLATIISHAPYTDLAVSSRSVARRLDESWDLIGTQSRLGRELWEYWYKNRFGILDP